jgi:hypothetical protein
MIMMIFADDGTQVFMIMMICADPNYHENLCSAFSFQKHYDNLRWS